MIKVFLITEKRINTNDDWPIWMSQAWQTGEVYRNKANIAVRGEGDVVPGDHITKNEDTGFIGVLREGLTAAEALYGFAAWLTARDEVTELGATSNCSVLPRLLLDFKKSNSLADPREGWENQLIYPT